MELNVYSPSDCLHWFPNIHLSSDEVEGGGCPTPDMWRAAHQYHDRRHGWCHGTRLRAAPYYGHERLFRPIPFSYDEPPLPQVEAVTALIIRRQFRRGLDMSKFGKILNKLACLRQVSLEPWGPLRSVLRDDYNKGAHSCLWPHPKPFSNVLHSRDTRC